VFAFLAERQNHTRLASRNIALLELADTPDGRYRGRMRIRGPFGLRRHATTRLTTTLEPSSLAGVARIGRRTTVEVSWQLHAVGRDRTRVVLSAVASSLGSVDRLLLLLGGAMWMERLFGVTLELLADGLGAPAPLAFKA
jgi:hypothetical protein